MAKVKYFNSCLCCSLRTGNIVYATFLSIVGVFGVILAILSMVYYFDEKYKLSEKFPLELIIGALVYFIINEILNVLLLYGVVKKISKLILPWLIFTGVMMCLSVVSTIYVFVKGAILVGISNIVGYIIGYLIFHCVLSYYKEIQLETPTNYKP